MTTVADLIDYLSKYPPTARVYLLEEHAQTPGEDYVALDRLWYAAEMADVLSRSADEEGRQ